jgi:hypothetical protein
MTTWNHRIVRTIKEDGPMLHLKEVHYDKAGNPVGYSNVFMMSEDMEGMKLLIARLAVAIHQPVLDEKEIIKEKETAR